MIVIQITHGSSSALSSSFSSTSELVHPDPLQLPQATEHFTLCFLHVHLILLQSVSLTVTSDYFQNLTWCWCM